MAYPCDVYDADTRCSTTDPTGTPMIDQIAGCLISLNAVLYHALPSAMACTLVLHCLYELDWQAAGRTSCKLRIWMGSNSQIVAKQMVAVL
jgi:hypothetical protein